uniref:Uncharacterized protein n=1 Tax=Cacopsylla melanoneura TaxID=428564 RepID=A0A8D8SEH7_9HEMI
MVSYHPSPPKGLAARGLSVIFEFETIFLYLYSTNATATPNNHFVTSNTDLRAPAHPNFFSPKKGNIGQLDIDSNILTKMLSLKTVLSTVGTLNVSFLKKKRT